MPSIFSSISSINLNSECDDESDDPVRQDDLTMPELSKDDYTIEVSLLAC